MKMTNNRFIHFLILSLIVSAPAMAGDVIFGDSFEGVGAPPQIVEVDELGAIAGANFLHQLHVAPGGDAITSWSVIAGPAGLTVDGAGLLDWIPTQADAGSQLVTVEVIDRIGRSDQEIFDLTVVLRNSPPVIADIDDMGATVDNTFNFTASASDPDVADVLVYGLDQAPAQLNIDPDSGLLSWTPGNADLGDHLVTARVTDSAAVADTASFLITVFASNVAPELDAIGDRGATPGEVFSFTLSASDADNDVLTFSLPERPTGMSVSPQAGVITWAPTAAAQGQALVTARVRDGRGGSDSERFIVVIDQNRSPVAVDDAYTVERGDTLTVTPPGALDNDTDPNFDVLSAVLETDVSAGTLALNSDGSFDYTPDVPTSTLGFVVKHDIPSPNGGPIGAPRVADVDADGATDIVVRYGNGTGGQNRMLVVRGDNGQVVYQSPPYDRSVANGTGTDILADIDLDGRLEIISIGAEGGRSIHQSGRKLVAMEHDGTFKWVSDAIPEQGIFGDEQVSQFSFANGEIAVADLDQDGTPEIIAGTGQGGAGEGIGVVVFDNQGKHLFTRYARGDISSISSNAYPEIVDLDLDGDLEILIHSAAFSHRGDVIWIRPELTNNQIRATPIAANLDSDPFPELIRAGDINGSGDSSNTIALNHDGSVLWQTPTNFAVNTLGVQLVVADVDDDGRPEVLGANNSFGVGRFEVLNGADGSLKWQYPPAAEVGLNFRGLAPTVFDLDRDGNTEVVLFTSDRIIHLLNGSDGSLINTFDLGISQTTFTSFPIFADVDADGAAELVLPGTFRFGFGASTAAWVFEAPNDDWMPAGSIWNQQNFHVTNINPDGTVPQFERPHWLLPGLNQNRVNGLLPEDRVASVDSFTYSANDGELQSNVATVVIDVLPPNNAPQILSMPRIQASPGFEYLYTPVVVDPDVGEILSFELVEAPAGMTIDAGGQISWTPASGDLGFHHVILRVTDSFGLSATQIFDVEVRGAATVPNVVGLVQVGAVAALQSADLTADPIDQVFSTSVPIGNVESQDPASGSAVAAGTPVRINVSKGPAPVPVPRVVGLDLDNAIEDIIEAGLATGSVMFVNRDDLPVDAVFAQSPGPQNSAPPGSAVNLMVSGGPRIAVEVSPRAVPSGGIAPFSVTVFNPDGTPEQPQPSVNVAIEFEPMETSGPAPQIVNSDISTDTSTAGQFRLRATVVDTAETFAAEFVVLPPIMEGEDGDIYTDFALQLDEFNMLFPQLQAAINANDMTAIADLDAQLLTLRDAIDLPGLHGTTPLAPQGGMPPDAATAQSMGFTTAPDDAAWQQAAIDFAGTLADMHVLVSDSASPDAFLLALNQQLVEQANALRELQPGVVGVLGGTAPAVDVLGRRVPALLVQDIDAIHSALVDAGLVGDSKRQGPLTKQLKFSLIGVVSAAGIRQRIISNVYYPILGELVRVALILAAENGLITYANAGSLVGIITAASQSIHVFEIPGSIIEGFGLEDYAPANTTVFVSPQNIANAVSILGSINSAEDFGDILDIKKSVVDLAESLVSAPQGKFSGCFLDSSPTCGQAVFDEGFESVYEASGPFALPAPTLIVTFGAATGNISVFVGIFLPTEAED